MRNAKSIDIAMPAPIAAATPRAADPVVYAAAKPATAPITIIPSTPRFSTPERSVTSSPIAASSSGVDAVMMVSRTASSPLMAAAPRPG